MSKAAQVQALTKAPISSFASTAFSRDSPNQAYHEAHREASMEERSNWHHVTSVRHIDRDKHQKKKQDPPKLDIQYKSSMKSCAYSIIFFTLPQKHPKKTACKIIACPCHASCARWSNMYLVLGSNCSNSCGCRDVGRYTHRIESTCGVIGGGWRPCWTVQSISSGPIVYAHEIWWYNINIPWNSCLKCSCCSSSLGWLISPSGQPARVVNAILAGIV